MRLSLILIAALLALPALAQEMPLIPSPKLWGVPPQPHITSAIPVGDIISGAIEGYARPRFKQLASNGAALKASVATLCATPLAANLDAARATFKSTALSYAGIEFFQLGPLGVDARVERLLFWPDRKGIALKQVQRVLATPDPTATDPVKLAGKSVALQGLGALEYVLFGTDADTLTTGAGNYRCQYAAAITTLVSDLATQLDTEWSATGPGSAADAMLKPQLGADEFRNQAEVLNKLGAALILGVDTVRDQRIMPILGAATGGPKPKQGLFYRSGLTIPMLAADIAGVQALFDAAHFGDAVGYKGGYIPRGAKFQFGRVADAFAAIHDPLEQVVADPKQLAALASVSDFATALDMLLGDNLSEEIGLSVGFSGLDRD